MILDGITMIEHFSACVLRWRPLKVSARQPFRGFREQWVAMAGFTGFDSEDEELVLGFYENSKVSETQSGYAGGYE